MTLLLSLVSVPLNTVAGIRAALLFARNDFPGKTFAISLLDLPFSISPVITGAARCGCAPRLCAAVVRCGCALWSCAAAHDGSQPHQPGTLHALGAAPARRSRTHPPPSRCCPAPCAM